MSECHSKLKKVQKSFRRALKTYDENAFVQLEIAQTLINILFEKWSKKIQKKHFNHVFEAGCGTGFLSKALLGKFTVNHLTVNDLVAECETRVGAFLADNLSLSGNQSLHSWEFVGGDINDCDISQNQDLICSASTLQWIENIPILLEKFDTSLSENGWLALSSFGPNHFSEIREINQQDANVGDELNYLDEKSWQVLLEKKFFIEDIQTQSITLWFDSFDELLRHLRNTGVNGNTRRQWSQAMKNDFAMRYETLFAQQGKLPLTYEPVYVVVSKKVASTKAQ